MAYIFPKDEEDFQGTKLMFSPYWPHGERTVMFLK